MLVFVFLLFLTGISALIFLKKELKLSYIISYSLLLGLGIHTAIFSLIGILNIYYSPLLIIIFTCLLALIAVFVYKKKNCSYVNDIKSIPVIYLIVLVLLACRLFTVISTGFANFFHWDELRVYQFISKEIFLTHNMHYMYSFNAPMSFFIGNSTYAFAGLDLVNPRIFNIFLFLNISVIIYSVLLENGVSKRTSQLLAILYLFCSAENLLYYRSFYNNLHYGAFFTAGIYLFNKGLFNDNKADFRLGYILLFFSIFIRREAVFLLIGYLLLLYIYLIVKKKKHFIDLIKIISIPVLYQLIYSFLQRSFIIQSQYHPFTIPLDEHGRVLKKSIYDNLTIGNISFDNIISYFKSAFDQMFCFNRFSSNYIVFGITLIIIIFIIYKLCKKEKIKNIRFINSILLAELVYFGIVFATQAFIMNESEFTAAASLSRYLLSVVPINFVLLGSLIFVSKNEDKSVRKLEPIKDPKVLIIVPCYNESANISGVYKNFIEYKKNCKYQVDMIVVNDCSTDNTLDIIRANNIPHINLIQNLGIGGAVQTGYRYANMNDYDIAIQIDGDGQHDISYIEKLIEPLVLGQADMAIASRFVNKNLDGFKSTAARRIGIKIISSTIKMVTGKKIYDPTSGFRAANKSIIVKFANNYPQEYPEAITDSILLKEDFIIKEIPTVMKDRSGGKSSIGSWKNVYFMINVLLLIIINGVDE